MIPRVAGHLTQEIVRLAEVWPRQLVSFIDMLETGGRGGFNVFAQQRHVRSLSRQLDGFAVRSSATSAETHPWEELEDGTATVQCGCELELLAMKDFAGQGNNSAFSRLFMAGQKMNASDFNKLMQSRLIVTTTQFKWQTFALHRLKRRLCMLVLHFANGTFALLASTAVLEDSFQEQDHRVLVITADVARCMLVVITNSLLQWKLRQMHRAELVLGHHLLAGWHATTVASSRSMSRLLRTSQAHYM